MYRGRPPHGKLLKVNQQTQRDLVSSQCATATLNNIQYNSAEPRELQRIRIFLKIRELGKALMASEEVGENAIKDQHEFSGPSQDSRCSFSMMVK